jgi:hypothetical protein
MANHNEKEVMVSETSTYVLFLITTTHTKKEIPNNKNQILVTSILCMRRSKKHIII